MNAIIVISMNFNIQNQKNKKLMNNYQKNMQFLIVYQITKFGKNIVLTIHFLIYQLTIIK